MMMQKMQQLRVVVIVATVPVILAFGNTSIAMLPPDFVEPVPSKPIERRPARPVSKKIRRVTSVPLLSELLNEIAHKKCVMSAPAVLATVVAVMKFQLGGRSSPELSQAPYRRKNYLTRSFAPRGHSAPELSRGHGGRFHNPDRGDGWLNSAPIAVAVRSPLPSRRGAVEARVPRRSTYRVASIPKLPSVDEGDESESDL